MNGSHSADSGSRTRLDTSAALRSDLRSRWVADTAAIRDPGNVRRWRAGLVRHLRRTWVLPGCSVTRPADVRELAREPRDGYELVRLYFRGACGWIPGCLLVPDHTGGGAGSNSGAAALCLHGNVPGAKWEVAGEEKQEGVPAGLARFRDDYARGLARRGVTCLVIDQPLQGERRTAAPVESDATSAFDAGIMTMLAAGRTYLGCALADQRTALDVLLAQPGVDRRRVGAVGFSMGGTLAVALAAVDRRVRCVCFGGYVPSWRERYLENPETQPLLACCPGMLNHFDLPELIAAVAPTPMLLAAEARGDENEERWLAPVRQAYDAWHVPERLRVWRPPVGPHAFHPVPVLDWFEAMLKTGRMPMPRAMTRAAGGLTTFLAVPNLRGGDSHWHRSCYPGGVDMRASEL